MAESGSLILVDSAGIPHPDGIICHWFVTLWYLCIRKGIDGQTAPAFCHDKETATFRVKPLHFRHHSIHIVLLFIDIARQHHPKTSVHSNLCRQQRVVFLLAQTAFVGVVLRVVTKVPGQSGQQAPTTIGKQDLHRQSIDDGSGMSGARQEGGLLLRAFQHLLDVKIGRFMMACPCLVLVAETVHKTSAFRVGTIASLESHHRIGRRTPQAPGHPHALIE